MKKNRFQDQFIWAKDARPARFGVTRHVFYDPYRRVGTKHWVDPKGASNPGTSSARPKLFSPFDEDWGSRSKK